MNKGHQEETHHPTHRFRTLFLDLLSMDGEDVPAPWEPHEPCYQGWYPAFWVLLTGEMIQDLYLLSGKISYCQILWTLKAARSYLIMIVSFYKLAGILLNYCWGTCQSSEWLEKYESKSQGFNILQDVTVRHPSAQWIEALNTAYLHYL